jgi:hypothetical protein
MIEQHYIINASQMTTEIVQYLSAMCTDGSQTSRWEEEVEVDLEGEGEKGFRTDFKSRKDARRRTFGGNRTQNRGKAPFIDSQDYSLSLDRHGDMWLEN